MDVKPLLASAAFAGLAAACAATGAAPVEYRGDGSVVPTGRGPAPIEQRGMGQPTSSSAPPLAPVPAAEPDWAAGPGVPLSVWALRPEEAQPYDPRQPARAHHVAHGETLYTIAARRQVPLRALIDANGLVPPFAIEVGQVLVLPPPLVHTVQAGETLAGIARRYNVDLRSLALLNRMTPPYTISPGDRLVAPTGARASMVVPYAPSASPVPVRPAHSPAAPAGDAPRFARPVAGEVLVPFGPRGTGARSDGMEIAAPVGTPVQAAGDGVVLYVGSDLENHGVVVIIAHTGDWVTTYAYNQRASVQAGQRVRRGEVIAQAGGAPEGQSRLLFQVRRGSEPVNPGPLFAE
ncbi:MAG: LysM peptidoglycan-binding domain-containing protein [Caulobacterales bacterium]